MLFYKSIINAIAQVLKQDVLIANQGRVADPMSCGNPKAMAFFRNV